MAKRKTKKPNTLGAALASVLGALFGLVIVCGILFIINTFTGCSSESAKANGGCNSVNFSASDGARCYAIYCDGKAIGGNCL